MESDLNKLATNLYNTFQEENRKMKLLECLRPQKRMRNDITLPRVHNAK